MTLKNYLTQSPNFPIYQIKLLIVVCNPQRVLYKVEIIFIILYIGLKYVCRLEITHFPLSLPLKAEQLMITYLFQSSKD